MRLTLMITIHLKLLNIHIMSEFTSSHSIVLTTIFFCLTFLFINMALKSMPPSTAERQGEKRRELFSAADHPTNPSRSCFKAANKLFPCLFSLFLTDKDDVSLRVCSLPSGSTNLKGMAWVEGTLSSVCC